MQAVGGLDTSVRLRPRRAAKLRIRSPPAIGVPSCAGATSAPADEPRRLPARRSRRQPGVRPEQPDRGGRTAAASRSGSSSSRAIRSSDVDHFRSCFPGHHGTSAPTRSSAGARPDMSGKGEVALDLEVAMAAAPDAELTATSPRTTPTSRPRSSTRCGGRSRHHRRQLGRLRAADRTGAAGRAENTSLELRRWPASRRSWPRATSDRPTASRSPGSNNLFVDDPVLSRSRPPSAARRSRCPRCSLARRPGTGRAAASRSTGESPATSSARPSPRPRPQVPQRHRAVPRDSRRLARRAPQSTGYIIYCNRRGAGPGVVWAPSAARARPRR